VQDKKLVTMANQIAQFFEAYPQDQAIAGVAEHLQKFWEPGMQKRLREIADTQSETLYPLVQLALAKSTG
jgi:formate dehydrogenase subunit delta